MSEDEPNKFIQLVNALEGVMKKNIGSRNVTDQTIMNKFIAKSKVLS